MRWLESGAKKQKLRNPRHQCLYIWFINICPNFNIYKTYSESEAAYGCDIRKKNQQSEFAHTLSNISILSFPHVLLLEYSPCLEA